MPKVRVRGQRRYSHDPARLIPRPVSLTPTGPLPAGSALGLRSRLVSRPSEAIKDQLTAAAAKNRHARFRAITADRLKAEGRLKPLVSSTRIAQKISAGIVKHVLESSALRPPLSEEEIRQALDYYLSGTPVPATLTTLIPAKNALGGLIQDLAEPHPSHPTMSMTPDVGRVGGEIFDMLYGRGRYTAKQARKFREGFARAIFEVARDSTALRYDTKDSDSASPWAKLDTVINELERNLETKGSLETKLQAAFADQKPSEFQQRQFERALRKAQQDVRELKGLVTELKEDVTRADTLGDEQEDKIIGDQIEYIADQAHKCTAELENIVRLQARAKQLAEDFKKIQYYATAPVGATPAGPPAPPNSIAIPIDDRLAKALGTAIATAHHEFKDLDLKDPERQQYEQAATDAIITALCDAPITMPPVNDDVVLEAVAEVMGRAAADAIKSSAELTGVTFEEQKQLGYKEALASFLQFNDEVNNVVTSGTSHNVAEAALDPARAASAIALGRAAVVAHPTPVPAFKFPGRSPDPKRDALRSGALPTAAFAAGSPLSDPVPPPLTGKTPDGLPASAPAMSAGMEGAVRGFKDAIAQPIADFHGALTKETAEEDEKIKKERLFDRAGRPFVHLHGLTGSSGGTDFKKPLPPGWHRVAKTGFLGAGDFLISQVGDASSQTYMWDLPFFKRDQIRVINALLAAHTAAKGDAPFHINCVDSIPKDIYLFLEAGQGVKKEIQITNAFNDYLRDFCLSKKEYNKLLQRIEAHNLHVREYRELEEKTPDLKGESKAGEGVAKPTPFRRPPAPVTPAVIPPAAAVAHASSPAGVPATPAAAPITPAVASPAAVPVTPAAAVTPVTAPTPPGAATATTDGKTVDSALRVARNSVSHHDTTDYLSTTPEEKARQEEMRLKLIEVFKALSNTHTNPPQSDLTDRKRSTPPGAPTAATDGEAADPALRGGSANHDTTGYLDTKTDEEALEKRLQTLLDELHGSEHTRSTYRQSSSSATAGTHLKMTEHKNPIVKSSRAPSSLTHTSSAPHTSSTEARTTAGSHHPPATGRMASTRMDEEVLGSIPAGTLNSNASPPIQPTHAKGAAASSLAASSTSERTHERRVHFASSTSDVKYTESKSSNTGPFSDDPSLPKISPEEQAKAAQIFDGSSLFSENGSPIANADTKARDISSSVAPTDLNNREKVRTVITSPPDSTGRSTVFFGRDFYKTSLSTPSESATTSSVSSRAHDATSDTPGSDRSHMGRGSVIRRNELCNSSSSSTGVLGSRSPTTAGGTPTATGAAATSTGVAATSTLPRSSSTPKSPTLGEMEADRKIYDEAPTGTPIGNPLRESRFGRLAQYCRDALGRREATTTPATASKTRSSITPIHVLDPTLANADARASTPVSTTTPAAGANTSASASVRTAIRDNPPSATAKPKRSEPTPIHELLGTTPAQSNEQPASSSVKSRK